MGDAFRSALGKDEGIVAGFHFSSPEGVLIVFYLVVVSGGPGDCVSGIFGHFSGKIGELGVLAVDEDVVGERGEDLVAAFVKILELEGVDRVFRGLHLDSPSFAFFDPAALFEISVKV